MVFPLFLATLFIFVLSLFILNKFIKRKTKDILDERNELYEQENRQMVKMIDSFSLVKNFNKVDIELEKSDKLLSKHPEY